MCSRELKEVKEIILNCGCKIDEYIKFKRFLEFFPICIDYRRKGLNMYFCPFCKEFISKKVSDCFIIFYFNKSNIVNLTNEFILKIPSFFSHGFNCNFCSDEDKPTIKIFDCSCIITNICYICLFGKEFLLKNLPLKCESCLTVEVYSINLMNLFRFLGTSSLFKLSKQIFGNISSANIHFKQVYD